MTAHNKLQTEWEEMTPVERLCVSVIVQANRDAKSSINRAKLPRPRELYGSRWGLIKDASGFLDGWRLEWWCCAMGADGEKVRNGIRQMEGRS